MARRMTAVFILLARRIAKDVRAPDVTAGVAQGHEQFGSQRSDRSIACTRLARSSTYDLDLRAGHNGADGYRRVAGGKGKGAPRPPNFPPRGAHTPRKRGVLTTRGFN